MAKKSSDAEVTWTFLTNHAHVLICLERDATMRLRDLAEAVGITERAVHRIVVDLEAAGYLSHDREGRRNHYVIHASRPLRHPLEAHHTAAMLLELARDRRPQRKAVRAR